MGTGLANSKQQSPVGRTHIMKTLHPTLEDILKIASFKFNEDGELIQTSLDADFYGDHIGYHIGNHKGTHYGNHNL